jgi:hypothetical protein
MKIIISPLELAQWEKDSRYVRLALAEMEDNLKREAAAELPPCLPLNTIPFVD